MNSFTRQKKESSGNFRDFLSKLSRGLMIPIALLPIAGLFLGIGAGIAGILDAANLDESTNPAAYVIPMAMQAIGNVIFGNLPILFCIAIAIAFTSDAGVAALSAVVAWLVFNAFQSLFITPSVFDDQGNIMAYDILFYNNVPASVVTKNVGITSLQTSVFGGMAVGFVVASIYNRFHKLQLPKILGFFSGTKSVPIITFILMPGVAVLFLFTWPLAGIFLDRLGAALYSLPLGINALLFGIIERSLIPFGLHHAFYTPLWFTSAGGQAFFFDPTMQGGVAVYQGDESMWFGFQEYGIPYSSITDTPYTPVPGFNQIVYEGEVVGYITAGAEPGTYLQGKYSFMIFGLPAAGAAMIMAAKKENREIALSVIGAAALTSFLTGITEPIEFTFLFVAPFLYYGFHIWMCGISFWIPSLVGAHLGMTFSGGIIDYMLYGILPAATGFHVKAWIVPLVGIVYIPIYYFTFYFYITKHNIPTPGRTDQEVKMVSKAEYLKAKNQKQETSSEGLKTKKSNKKGDRSERVALLIKNLGGLDNVTSINACITRLRLTIADRKKVNDEGLKAMGSPGIVNAGPKSIQIIFGGEADIFKSELLEQKHLQEEKNNN